MKDLNVGMRVYLRDDLQEGVSYGHDIWSRYMHRGMWVQVVEIFDDGSSFYIKNGGAWGYTPEMIDWDKTLNKPKQRNIQEGMRVYLKDDLQEGISYSPKGNQWYPSMKRGEWATITKLTSQNGFNVANSGMWVYSPDMIDWDKTEEYYMVEPNPNPMFDIKWCDIVKMKEQETMNKLEAGMWVYLRDDLQENEKYGYTAWVSSMHKGIRARIKYISDDYTAFRISIQENFVYTPEMIDWEKTKRGKETMEDWEEMKRENKKERESSKSKLKFKLYNEGNLIVFSILEQCPSITRMDDDLSKDPFDMAFDASNGIAIYSHTNTSFSFNGDLDEGPNLIFLRGCDDYNQNPTTATLRCEDEGQAKYLIKEMLKALQEFKDNNYFTGKEDNTLKLNENDKYQIYEI